MTTVLLTDGQQRKTLSAVRSLGQQGFRVLVADETRCSLSRFSRYAWCGLTNPPLHRPDDAFLDWMQQTRIQYRPDVIIPMDDETTRIAAQYAETWPEACLVPTIEQWQMGADKWSTLEMARRAGIPVPATAPIDSRADLDRAYADYGPRVILKPRRSSGGRGIGFLDSGDAARDWWTRWHPRFGAYLLQKRIAVRRKYDVGLLYDAKGHLCAQFVQEELRWFPPAYGSSTLQQSVSRPDLVDLATQLLKPIGWRGPVEVEFTEDDGGRLHLMEINPRFWASLALAVYCGVDFPGLAARLALGEAVKGPPHYQVGIRCRWSLPGDLLNFVVDPLDRFRHHANNGHRPLVFDDIWSWTDPGPTLGFMVATFRYAIDRHMWRWVMRW